MAEGDVKVEESPPEEELADASPPDTPVENSTESGAPAEPSGVKIADIDEGAPPASPEPAGDFTESGASPEPDGGSNETGPPPEPPQVPEVVDPNGGGVLVLRRVDADGSQTLLLDLDGDGLFDTRAVGQELEDGSFKIVSSETLDEPVSVDDVGGDADPSGSEAVTGTPEITVENADEAGTEVPLEDDAEPDPGRFLRDGPQVTDDFTREEPDTGTPEITGDPKDEGAPGAGDAPVEPPAGEVAPEPPVAEVAPEPPAGDAPVYEAPAAEVDLPELYEPPPRYATGSDGHAPSAGYGDPSTAPVDAPGAEAPVAPVPAADQPDASDDEPIDVNAEDGDDPGLLEQVADAIGDLFDEAKDAVT